MLESIILSAMLVQMAWASSSLCTPAQPVLLHGFPDSLHLDSSVFAALNASLWAAYTKLGNIPCQSAVIVYGGDKLAEFHYGVCNTTSGAKASGDTLYRIASLTKIFTDVAAMRVAETTGTPLQTRVVMLEPRFKVQDPYPGGRNGADITLEHLGTHMSGLYDSEPCQEDDTLGSHCLQSQVFDNLPKTQLALPVGFRPAYSNFGFSLLGYVLEPLMGSSYESFVTQHVLRPFGMLQSTFNVSDPSVVSKMAQGGGNRSRFVQSGFSAPAGDMVSSTNDLAKFISVLLGKQDQYVVSDQALRSSLNAKYVFEDGNIAMGFPWEMHRYSFDSFSIWSRTKDGNFDGFSSSIEVVPELNFGVAILNNNMGMDAHFLTQPLVQYLAPIVRAALIKARIPQPVGNPSTFIGHWANETAGLSLSISSYDATTGFLNVSNFNGGATGYLELQSGSTGGSETHFIFRALSQVQPTDTWGVEKGCMLWLFNNADGTQVIFRVKNGVTVVYLVGQAGYNIGLSPSTTKSTKQK